MSFLADNKSRPRLVVDSATAEEPPLKRLRSVPGIEPAVGEVGYGVGTALGLARTGLDPFSVAAYGRALADTSLLGADAMAWPGLDEHMLAASGLSASLGSFGSLGAVGTLGSLGTIGALGLLGSLGASSTAASFIERNLPKLDNSLVIPLQGNPLTSLAGIQLAAPNSLSKTRFCKHFIENNCKFNESCNFAHSIEELKRMPGERDLEGKLLLERYKAKADASNQNTSVGSVVELKTKLCKHFIDGECKFKEACHFAHGIEDLKKLPEDGDDAGKTLLERYKAKAGISVVTINGQSIAALPQIELPSSTSAVAKTKLCKHFITGNCKFKESCTFAHGIEELKSLPGEGDDAGRDLLEQRHSEMDSERLKHDQVKEALTPDETAGVEAEKKSVEAQAAQKLESQSSLSSEIKEENKSVRLLKTKMCKHFMIGACKYNKNCTFAHSIEELKPPPDAFVVKIASTVPMPSPAEKASNVEFTQTVQALQQVDGKEGLTQNKDDRQGFLKTKPCKFFSLGTCRFGIACSFIHNPLVHGINSSGGASQSGLLQGSAADMKATFKTRFCNMWEKDKTCSFGSKCNFAHGTEELRHRAGPSIPATSSFSASNSLMHGIVELEALSQAQQLGLSSSLTYSYDITDTNWRPFRAAEEAIHGLGESFGLLNERSLDRGAAELLHLRSLLQNYGQVEQASSLAHLSLLGGVNVGLTSNILPNLPSRATRFQMWRICD